MQSRGLKLIILLLAVFMWSTLPAQNQAAQDQAAQLQSAQDQGRERGGRHDAAIRAELERYLTSTPDFRNVRSQVEDGVVRLEGTVELYSLKRRVETKAEKIPQVQSVSSTVAVARAVADELVLAALRQRLSYRSLSEVGVQVHQGMVTVRGTVADQHDRSGALFIIYNTPGVLEVDDQIQVMGRM